MGSFSSQMFMPELFNILVDFFYRFSFFSKKINFSRFNENWFRFFYAFESFSPGLCCFIYLRLLCVSLTFQRNFLIFTRELIRGKRCAKCSLMCSFRFILLFPSLNDARGKFENFYVWVFKKNGGFYTTCVLKAVFAFNRVNGEAELGWMQSWSKKILWKKVYFWK